MKGFSSFLKNNARLIAAAFMDILAVPFLILCERLSAFMIAQNSVCQWTLIGINCGTCGGTRMVNAILHGDFVKAFNLNQFLFLCTVYLAIGFIVMNLAWVFKVGFAKKLLKMMFGLKALLISIGLFVAFIVVRNIPFAIRVIKIISNHI